MRFPRRAWFLPAAVVALAASVNSTEAAPIADPPSPTTEPIRIGPVPGGSPARRPDLRTPTDGVVSVDLRAVESRIADQGPLDAGLRWLPGGLQLPAGYERVYRLDNGDLMRADGGLVATFDQSVYLPTRGGSVPVIPASTLFVIGGVPLGAESGHGRLLAVDPLDPGAVPGLTPPTATPDAAHRPHATPGDRRLRFGFGPGHRVPDRVDGGIDEAMRAPGSRFTLDADYRAERLSARLSAWRRSRDAVRTPTPAPSPDPAP